MKKSVPIIILLGIVQFLNAFWWWFNIVAGSFMMPLISFKTTTSTIHSIDFVLSVLAMIEAVMLFFFLKKPIPKSYLFLSILVSIAYCWSSAVPWEGHVWSMAFISIVVSVGIIVVIWRENVSK